MTISLPVQLDESSAFEFLTALRRDETRADFSGELSIDFSLVRFAMPFGALLVGSGLVNFLLDLPPQVRIIPKGIDLFRPAHSYLAHIGFFDLLGLAEGNAIGEAQGGIHYLPVTELDRGELDGLAERRGKPLAEIIQERAEHFAAVLTQKRELKTNRPIAYCLREIVRNVFEHAGTDSCLVAAQRWNDETVEIAILDEGRGIRASLAERHVFPDDEIALLAALRPGVSRASIEAGEGDFWANSGFGLYVLSELGSRLGSFTLCSGEAVVRTGEGAGRSRGFRFSGTAVKLRVRRPKNQNFEELISRIISDGEGSSGGAQDGVRRASKSTRMV